MRRGVALFFLGALFLSPLVFFAHVRSGSCVVTHWIFQTPLIPRYLGDVLVVREPVFVWRADGYREKYGVISWRPLGEPFSVGQLVPCTVSSGGVLYCTTDRYACYFQTMKNLVSLAGEIAVFLGNSFGFVAPVLCAGLLLGYMMGTYAHVEILEKAADFIPPA